jgi:hypothetical protein
MELAASKWPDVPDLKLMLTIVKRENLLYGEQVPYSQGWHLLKGPPWHESDKSWLWG